MNEKITISQFAANLAKATGYKTDFCEQFVHEMFRSIAEALKDDKSVKIKGLGTFMVGENGKTLFLPDATLADTVNEPFSFFQPEELDDDVTDEILSQGITDNDSPSLDSEKAQSADDSAENEIEVETTIEKSKPEEIVAAEEAVAEELTSEEAEETNETPLDESGESTEPAVVDEITENDNDNPDEDVIENDVDDDIEDNQHSQRHGYRLWALITAFIIGAIIGAAITYYLLSQANDTAEATTTKVEEQTTPTEVKEPTSTKVETKSAQPAQTQVQSTETQADKQPEEQPQVTETVTAGNFLTKMARRHYGRYEFWVYIYQENSAILDNPDRIEPNTVVVIPPAEKYGIDKNNPQSIERANKLAGEIYSRFR
jgi:nucleoid-associated protein YgaU